MVDSPEQEEQERFPPVIVERFLELQTKEIAVRQQEMELRKQDSAQSFEFAKESLAAQERDRKHGREHRRSFLSGLLWLSFGIAALLTIIMIVALIYNQTDILKDLIQAFICIIGGYALGYARIGSAFFAKDDEMIPPSDD